jgi:hypothetical protein
MAVLVAKRQPNVGDSAVSRIAQLIGMALAFRSCVVFVRLRDMLRGHSCNLDCSGDNGCDVTKNGR